MAYPDSAACMLSLCVSEHFGPAACRHGHCERGEPVRRSLGAPVLPAARARGAALHLRLAQRRHATLLAGHHNGAARTGAPRLAPDQALARLPGQLRVPRARLWAAAGKSTPSFSYIHTDVIRGVSWRTPSSQQHCGTAHASVRMQLPEHAGACSEACACKWLICRLHRCMLVVDGRDCSVARCTPRSALARATSCALSRRARCSRGRASVTSRAAPCTSWTAPPRTSTSSSAPQVSDDYQTLPCPLHDTSRVWSLCVSHHML